MPFKKVTTVEQRDVEVWIEKLKDAASRFEVQLQLKEVEEEVVSSLYMYF